MKLRPGTDRPPVPRASFNRTAWLFPLLLAVHVAEERAGGFTPWAQKFASPRNRRVFFGYYAAVLTQQAVFNPIFHAGPRWHSARTHLGLSALSRSRRSGRA
jgi:hypothetical protein